MATNAIWVVLLRGINVGGNRKVPMAALRDLAEELGYTNVTTYLNSGNLIGQRDAEAATVRTEFERALRDHFGFDIDVVVRTSDAFSAVAAECPFPDAATERPNLVHVVFGHDDTTPRTLEVLADYLSEEERADIAAGHLWVDYAGGSGRSRVNHDVLRRAFGGIVTSRNLRTVRRLSEMASADKT